MRLGPLMERSVFGQTPHHVYLFREVLQKVVGRIIAVLNREHPPFRPHLLGDPLYEAPSQPGASHVHLSEPIGLLFLQVYLQADRNRDRLIRPPRKRHRIPPAQNRFRRGPPLLARRPGSVAVGVSWLKVFPTFLTDRLVDAQADRVPLWNQPGCQADHRSPRTVHLTEKGPAEKGVKPRVVSNQARAGSPQVVGHRGPNRGKHKTQRQQQKNRLPRLRKTLGQAVLNERGEARLSKSVNHGDDSWMSEEDHSYSHPFTTRVSPWFLFWPHGHRKSLE